jgi:hypothetical protein
MQGTTPEGLVIVSNVVNSGTLEAAGEAARLAIDGTVTSFGPNGNVSVSGSGAHIDLSRATLRAGSLSIGESNVVQSLADTGQSFISGAAVTGAGTLQANAVSSLILTNSSIADGITLVSNGIDSLLSTDATLGTVAANINGGEIELAGPSAANVTFAAGQVGMLRLDSTFTGTVSGLAGNLPVTFTKFFAFGDSTVDTGALQYLSPFLPAPPNPGLTTRLKNALANGGTDTPVGVGLMNTQVLAGYFGLSANTAYTADGNPDSGGTDYAISGALDAAVFEPGNGNIGNINQAHKPNPDPHLLSTVDQMSSYLTSTGGSADPGALYLISSGGNDISYANNFIFGTADQDAFLSTQAQSLTSEVVQLYRAGARNIIVNSDLNDTPLALFYSQQLFADLDASGIAYIRSDVSAMVQDIQANPAAYGFMAGAVGRGVAGPTTESALIEPDTTHNLHGWGLWGANTTTAETGGLQTNQQYSYLNGASNAEQTHLFADDQHLSAAGQTIEANFDYNLLVNDAIDLTTLPYVPGSTTASFNGNTANGTLTASSGTGANMQSVDITLLGNYMAAAFVTASDGHGGTLVMEQATPPSQQLLATAHN